MINLMKLAVVVAVFSALSYGERAYGQFSNTQATTRSSFRGGGQSIQDQVLRRPTVSPYLNLLSSPNENGVPTYFTQVRPQIEARNAAQRIQRQFGSVQQQFNSLNSRVSQNQQGGVLITGHPTRYMNYLQYYPGFNR